MPIQPDNSALRYIFEAQDENELFSLTTNLLSSFNVAHFLTKTAKRNGGLPLQFMKPFSSRTIEIINELILGGKDPVSRISRNTFIPYDLFAYRADFDEDPLIAELYRRLENEGADPFYIFSSHIPGADVHLFYLDTKDGQLLSDVELNILQGVFLYVSIMRSQFIKSDEAHGKISSLTKRETEVLHLMAQGLTDRDIGQKLKISLVTVGFHVKNAKQKLGARNKCHAIYLSGINGERSYQ